MTAGMSWKSSAKRILVKLDEERPAEQLQADRWSRPIDCRVQGNR